MATKKKTNTKKPSFGPHERRHARGMLAAVHDALASGSFAEYRAAP